MLTIRPEQMEALRAAQIAAFAERMREHLRSTFPGRLREFTDPALRQLINMEIPRALRYGLLMEWDIRRFLELRVLWGRDFEMFPLMREAMLILEDSTLAGREKMDRIEQLDNY